MAGIAVLHTEIKYFEQDADEAIANSRNMQNIAQQMREKMKGENAERTQAIRRLQEISRIGSLNNATQDETNRLIKKYGFDMKVVNGQLVNMGDSFDALLKKQEELGKRQLALSYEKEIHALEAEMDMQIEKVTGFVNFLLNSPNVIWTGVKNLFKKDGEKELDNIEKEAFEIIEATQKKVDRLIDERDKILGSEGNEKSKDDGGKPEQDTAKAQRPALEALKEQRRQYAMSAMDAAQLRTELEKQSKELKNQISQHMDISKFTYEEIAALSDKDLEILGDDDLGKLKQILELEQKIRDLQKEGREYVRQAHKSLLEYQQERQRDTVRRQFDKSFDRRLDRAKTKSDDQQVADIAARRVELAKKKAAQALKFYNDGLEAAGKDNIITEKEKEELDRRLQILKDADALVVQETERRENALEAIENHAVRRQQDRNNRRAKELEKQADAISRKLKNLGMDNLDRDGISFDKKGKFRGNVGAGELAKARRERDSMAETRRKLEAQNNLQKYYIDDRGRQRRVHFNKEDLRNMKKIDRMEQKKRDLQEKAKDYTKPIESLKGAIETLGKNCVIVKR